MNTSVIISISQATFYTIVGSPEKDLRGEIALVTGGGGGLGRLLSLRLARLGVRVIVWDINQEGNMQIEIRAHYIAVARLGVDFSVFLI